MATLLDFKKLLAAWDQDKNSGYDFLNHSINSNKKFYWTCPNQHVSYLTIRKKLLEADCQKCLDEAKIAASLAVQFPEVAGEWHIEKNYPKNPLQFSPGSSEKVYWQCLRGHIWQTSISHRTNKNKPTGCPKCPKPISYQDSLEFSYPDLAKEWHSKKNNLLPAEVTPGSKRKVYWKCRQGHVWSTTIRHRVNGTGCPKCRKEVPFEKSLLNINPRLASEWHLTKNSIKPSEVSPGSDKRIWWKCQQGHVFKAAVKDRSRGSRCPKCVRQVKYEDSLAFKRPDLAKEWHKTKNSKSPSQVGTGIDKKAWWKCQVGHVFKSSIKSRVAGTGCPKCANSGGFQDDQPGYLYLLYSDKHKCFQVGITNKPKDRLKLHARNGSFKAKEVLLFKNGREARLAEQKILGYFKDNNFKPALTKKEMPQGGFSETVSKKDVKELSLTSFSDLGLVVTSDFC
jgi:uncharacterized Zn ribbon protein